MTAEISKKGRPRSSRQLSTLLDALGILRDIDLASPLRSSACREFLAEARQLFRMTWNPPPDRARCFRNIHQVDQQSRPLDMPQELDSESVAEMRAFDQPRNIGDDEGRSSLIELTTPRFGSSVVNG